MNLKWYQSLTFRMSLLLVLFALTTGFLSYFAHTGKDLTAIEQRAMTALSEQMNVLQGTLEFLYRTGSSERIQAEISSRGTDPALSVVLIVDENNTVVASQHLAQRGLPLDEILKDTSESLRAYITDLEMVAAFGNRAHVVFDQADDAVVGVYPLFAASAGDSDQRPVYRGSLVMIRSLTPEKQAASKAIAAHLLELGVALILLTAMLAFAGYRLLSRRVSRLVNAASRFSAGDYSVRVDENGQDELARAGLAFNAMTEKVSATLDALESSEKRFRLLLESSCDAIVATDTQGVCVFSNSATKSLFDRNSASQLTGSSLAKIIGDDDSSPHSPVDMSEVLRSFRQGCSRFSGEFRYRGETNPGKVIGYSAYPLVNEEMLEGVLLVFSNITERREAEQRVEKLAHFDTLTNLPNRSLFNDRLKYALVRAQRRSQLVALLFIDLDNFKIVNDTLGHQVGDLLLQNVSSRLQSCVRQEDTVARLGGDEFTVILENVPDEHIAIAIGNKIVNALNAPFLIDGNTLQAGGSIGVAVYPVDGEDSVTLIKNADTAMYQAKDLGRCQVIRYVSGHSDSAEQRFRMEKDFRRALQEQQLVLYLQPQVNIGGELIGGEVLVRWMHPDGRIVPPLEFLSLAREIGLAGLLDEYVLKATCQLLADWIARGYRVVPVAVNLSGVQINDGTASRMVDDILQASGVSADLLELEITEGFIMSSPERAISALQDLQDMGVSIAVDDFGTGHSSLAYLKRLPVNRLKIDRSFVQDIHEDRDDQVIVSALIAMAHRLSLDVVAEGVETNQQLAVLQNLGCSKIQGYYFSRPVPAQKFTGFLEQGRVDIKSRAC